MFGTGHPVPGDVVAGVQQCRYKMLILQGTQSQSQCQRKSEPAEGSRDVPVSRVAHSWLQRRYGTTWPQDGGTLTDILNLTFQSVVSDEAAYHVGYVVHGVITSLKYTIGTLKLNELLLI